MDEPPYRVWYWFSGMTVFYPIEITRHAVDYDTWDDFMAWIERDAEEYDKTIYFFTTYRTPRTTDIFPEREWTITTSTSSQPSTTM